MIREKNTFFNRKKEEDKKLGDKEYKIPKVIVDAKEKELIESLTKKYEKMIEPGKIKRSMKKVGTKVNNSLPQLVKDFGSNAKNIINEQEIMKKCLEVLAKDFQMIQEFAAKYTISQEFICKTINKQSKNNEIKSLDEFCLLRAYDIRKTVEKYKTIDIGSALAQGAVLGATGFVGIPFNLVISTFLFFRAVQSIAMFYGYDVKNKPEELKIAGEVFSKAMSPESSDNNALAQDITKIMLITETTVVKQTATKGWGAMANKNYVTLLITQMRALASKSAQKALEKAGKGNLEKNIFSEVFEQIGKKLTQKSLANSLSNIIGAIIGGTIDTSQMIRVLNYANTFYCKRFILEKEDNINMLLNTINDNLE